MTCDQKLPVTIPWVKLIVRAEGLQDVNTIALQRALGERIKVRRREVRLPLGEEQVWRAELLRTLEATRDALA